MKIEIKYQVVVEKPVEPEPAKKVKEAKGDSDKIKEGKGHKIWKVVKKMIFPKKAADSKVEEEVVHDPTFVPTTGERVRTFPVKGLSQPRQADAVCPMCGVNVPGSPAATNLEMTIKEKYKNSFPIYVRQGKTLRLAKIISQVNILEP